MKEGNLGNMKPEDWSEAMDRKEAIWQSLEVNNRKKKKPYRWLLWFLLGTLLSTFGYLIYSNALNKSESKTEIIAVNDQTAEIERLNNIIDEVNQKVFANGTVKLGQGLWKRADAGLIDGWLVNGSARLVAAVAARVRRWQTGFLYDYAFTMIIGLIVILGVWVVLL